jgi:2-haloacid dehalogenase
VNAPVRPTVEAVVFDIGGVLLDWDPRHLYRRVFDDEEAMERFLGRICTPRWHEAHDRGESTADSCSLLAQAHPEHAAEIWAWSTRAEEMVAGSFPETVQILTDLTSAGVCCYALSNMEAETFPLRFERFPFFTLFDGIVISGQEGMAKPDRAIFELLCRRYGLEPGKTVFIDDTIGNVRAASALGLAAVHYRSPGALRDSLRDLGLLAGDHESGNSA